VNFVVIVLTHFPKKTPAQISQTSAPAYYKWQQKRQLAFRRNTAQKQYVRFQRGKPRFLPYSGGPGL
jgi:hypothetical protein